MPKEADPVADGGATSRSSGPLGPVAARRQVVADEHEIGPSDCVPAGSRNAVTGAAGLPPERRPGGGIGGDPARRFGRARDAVVALWHRRKMDRRRRRPARSEPDKALCVARGCRQGEALARSTARRTRPPHQLGGCEIVGSGDQPPSEPARRTSAPTGLTLRTIQMSRWPFVTERKDPPAKQPTPSAHARGGHHELRRVRDGLPGGSVVTCRSHTALPGGVALGRRGARDDRDAGRYGDLLQARPSVPQTLRSPPPPSPKATPRRRDVARRGGSVGRSGGGEAPARRRRSAAPGQPARRRRHRRADRSRDRVHGRSRRGRPAA